jgi:Flp pilus assembly protein TadG
MTARRLSGDDGEQGTVLVQVAVALLALLALSAFVVDYGVMWASRGQAQTAADSGALAGAMSLAFDSPTDLAGARARAIAMAARNRVWGQAPSVTDGDVTFPACPPGAPGPPDTCVKVDVFRNQARGNALPTFFGPLAEIENQGVRATATAQITTGNATDCLRPWAVADKWEEHWENGKASIAPWTPDSTFDKYDDKGNLDPKVTIPDVYRPPTATDPGTGFTPFDADGNPTAYYGLEMTLKNGDSKANLSSGWFLGLNLPDGNGNPTNGGSTYRDNIANCNPHVFAIGDTIEVESKQGDMVGPTKQGVQDLMALDNNAKWNTSTKSIDNSCAPGVCGDLKYHASSPRIVPVALFNLDAFFAGTPNGKSEIPIANIMGFFVEGMSGKDVLGRLVAIPGTSKGTSSLPTSSSFMRQVLLVR